MNFIEKSLPGWIRETPIGRDIIRLLIFIVEDVRESLKSKDEGAFYKFADIVFPDGDEENKRIWFYQLYIKRGTKDVLELIVGRIFNLLFSEGRAVREWFVLNPTDYPREDRVPFLFDLNILESDPSLDLERLLKIIEFFRNERSRLIGIELRSEKDTYLLTDSFSEAVIIDEVYY